MRLTPLFRPVRTTASAALGGLLVISGLAGCAKDYGDSDASDSTAGECSYVETGASAGEPVDLPPTEPSLEGQVEATVTTSVGDIELVLDADAAPCTVNSFASLAEQGYFDDTTCHRIIADFMIQCGDPSATGGGDPGYSYADELTGEESYEPGTLAMANSGPDTNGSQFFLVTGAASHLSTHTVFGQVSQDSMDILRTVDEAWATGENTPVDIETVTIGS